MKKSDLLELDGYTVERVFRGLRYDGHKKYYYHLVLKNGTIYRIRQYDVKDFIARGAKYIER